MSGRKKEIHCDTELIWSLGVNLCVKWWMPLVLLKERDTKHHN